MQAIREELATLAVPEMLKRAGKAVMSVGGASGPLYGTLLLELGKGLPECEASRADWAHGHSRGGRRRPPRQIRRGREDDARRPLPRRLLAGAADADFPTALATPAPGRH